jgi:hypothetical protein
MKIRMIGAIVFAVCLAGCVPSLHELYTNDTLAYDPDLIGTWVSTNSTWTFDGDPNSRSYKLVIVEQDEKRGRLENKMLVHLVELDGVDYLDVFADKEVKLNVGNWFTTSLLRAHLFLKLKIKANSITLAIMNPDVVEKMLEKNPNLVKHEKTEDRVVLTASPKELQEFIKKNAATKDFFGEPEEMKLKESAGK